MGTRARKEVRLPRSGALRSDRKGKGAPRPVPLEPIDAREIQEAMEAVIGDGSHWLLDRGCSICGLLWTDPDSFVAVNEMLTGRPGERPTQQQIREYAAQRGHVITENSIRRHRIHMKEVGFWTALLGRKAEKLIEQTQSTTGGRADEVVKVMAQNLLMKLLLKANCEGGDTNQQIAVLSAALRYMTARPMAEYRDARARIEKRRSGDAQAQALMSAVHELKARLLTVRPDLVDEIEQALREGSAG